MGIGTGTRVETVERMSPTLFLVGGVLLVAHAAMLGVQAFSTLTPPPDVFGPAGHLLALVGLVGLYPAVADGSPTVARVAGAVGIVALVSWAAMAGTRLLAVATVVTSAGAVLPSGLFAILFVSTILAYVLFGVALLRVEDGSRAVGVLVLAPAVLLVVVLVDSAVGGVTALDGLVVGSGLALSVLVLGYTLRTRAPPTDRSVTASDVTVG